MVATAPSPASELAVPGAAASARTAVGLPSRARRTVGWRAGATRLGDLVAATGAVLILDPLPGRGDLLLAALAGALLSATTQGVGVPTVPRSEILRRVAGAGLVLVFVGVVLAGTIGAEVGPLRLVAFTAITCAAAFLLRAAGVRQGRFLRVVVAGHRHGVEQMLGELQDAASPVTIAAVCLTGQPRPTRFEAPVACGLDALPECVRTHDADAVIVVPGRQVDPGQLRRLGWQLERNGTPLFVGTGLRELGPGRARLGHAGSLPLIHVRHAQLRGARRIAKACWERSAAGLALLVLAPALLVIALAVRLDSAGPALFRQERVGRDGARFTMLKFRTMCVDAEDRLAALAATHERDHVLFKLSDDPRVTRVGRLLRRYSLDELPQLVNIVRGEMALVGPRPPLPREVEQYDVDTHRRLAVTPGLTGLWQVSGRSDLTWEQSVRLDLRYVENWSLGLDLAIIWRTLGAVLRHRGAY